MSDQKRAACRRPAMPLALSRRRLQIRVRPFRSRTPPRPNRRGSPTAALFLALLMRAGRTARQPASGSRTAAELRSRNPAPRLRDAARRQPRRKPAVRLHRHRVVSRSGRPIRGSINLRRTSFASRAATMDFWRLSAGCFLAKRSATAPACSGTRLECRCVIVFEQLPRFRWLRCFGLPRRRAARR